MNFLSALRLRTFGALLLLFATVACGPWGPQGIVAGGPFLGAADSLPADASFTDDHMLIAIETRHGWLRHSVTILCVSSDGKLYVMARHAPRKRWVQDIMLDPRVRLEIGGKLYAGRATRVDGTPDADAAVAHAFLRKYVGVEVDHAPFLAGAPSGGDDHAEMWNFRIDPAEDGT